MLAGLGAPGCSRASGAFQRTLPVKGPVDLEVLTGSGDVTARTGPPGSVSIQARIESSFSLFGGGGEDAVRAIERNPPIVQSGNSIRLERPRHGNVAIDYVVTVPPDTRLRADTGSGTHRVSGVRRGVDVRSGSGDVELEDIAGGVRADTGSGDVRGHRVAGPVDVSTGSGDVRLDVAGPGDVRAHTGSGGVDVRGVVGGLVIDTGSGDVAAAGVPRGRWSVETSSGDVAIRAGRQSYDLDVDTGSGDITVGRPLQMTVQGRITGGSHDKLSGRVGAGGPLIRVRTGSGDVDID
jgi:hypothetical protein